MCIFDVCVGLASHLGWYPGAQHPGSRWRKWGGQCGTKEEALASVIDWMVIEHKKAVSKMPIIVNEDMFDEVMAGLPLPDTRPRDQGPTSKRKAKDMAAKGLGRGRAIGRGKAKARGRRQRKRQAESPMIFSSEADSDTSTVSNGTVLAMAPTATVPEVAPPPASSSRSPPRATSSKAQSAKAHPAKAIALKAIPPKVNAKPSIVPGSNEDLLRQAKAALRKPKTSK